MAKILVTGIAGFIGFHVAQRLIEAGETVVGLDNLNDYYDVSLKHDRLEELKKYGDFEFIKVDLADTEGIKELFDNHKPEYVVHLAAQAGVRYSIEAPKAYIDSNLMGFFNILENCRQHKVKHLIFASSSSVYGANTKLPFATSDNVDHPISLYAATKKSNELMAHSYSHLYNLPTTGLRFFTVYGPWGRPDMALYLFAKALLKDEPISVFNYGKMRRDFTYIDDITEGVIRLIRYLPTPDPDWTGDHPTPGTSKAPYRIYNIGNHQPVELMHVIELIEKHMGKTAKKNMMPIQPGDVPATYAYVQDLEDAVGFKPNTSIEEGVERFIKWFRFYYKGD